MTKESHKQEKDEVQDILNLKIGELKDLDIEESDSVHEDESFEKSLNSIKNLSHGKEGLDELLNSLTVNQYEEKLKKGYSDKPVGRAFHELITQIDPADRTEKYKQEVQNSFSSSHLKIKELFQKVASGERIHHSNIVRIVETFMKIFISDRCILLNFSNYDNSSEDYLYPHVLKVCLLSMNIATALDYSKEQVMDVGVAGLLADIGMVAISEEMRVEANTLTKNDIFEIHKHPIVGLHILERIKAIPDPVAYVAYQHHERILGDGYPKGRGGRLIHNYAKIVAIADVYSALCSHRVYRQPQKPYDAMVKILHMARGEYLDKNFVKTFVELVSLFPVGSMVQLSNGQKAKVIQANGVLVDKPLVSIMGKEGTEKVLINLAQDRSLKIVESLPKKAGKNTALMEGF